MVGTISGGFVKSLSKRVVYLCVCNDKPKKHPQILQLALNSLELLVESLKTPMHPKILKKDAHPTLHRVLG